MALDLPPEPAARRSGRPARAARPRRRARRGPRGRLDLPGAALAATGFGLLTFGLVEGAERGFASVWWAFAVGAVALAGFVVVERRVAQPMLPFDLFRERNFAAANAETFLVYAGLYGFIVFFTLYLQFLGFTPFEAGLLNIPSSVVMILLAARFGGLADKHGPRLYLTLGPALIGVGTLVFALVETQSEFWTYGIAGLLLFSLGLAVMVAPITATALKSAPERYAGIASGVNSTVSRLGSLIAVAVIGLVISLVFDARTDSPAPFRWPSTRRRRSSGPPRSMASGRGWSSRLRSRSPAPPSGRSASRTGRRRRGSDGSHGPGAGASRNLSASARSRALATASSRVSPKQVKIASR